MRQWNAFCKIAVRRSTGKTLQLEQKGSRTKRKRDVGQTPNRGRRTAKSKRLYRRENLLAVARHLHATPFATELPIATDEKGRSLDSAHLPAVHVLHLHHAELLAEFFILVGNELEGKSHLGLEVLV